MRATMKHVAARAGVSIKTVSNVVNGSERVAPQTRQRVQAAIDELGFVPNATARSLRSGRSGVVALALPELDAPYFAELAQHVVEAARARGWTVLVDSTGGQVEQERLAASGIRPQLIDGLIFSPLALRASDLPDAAGGPPTVLLGERVMDAAVDLVTVDNHAVAGAAVEHLVGAGAAPDRGPRRADHRDRRHRPAPARGVPTGARPRGSAVRRRPRRRGRDLASGGGGGAARALVDAVSDVDAIVCFNDLLALGALRGLADAGVRVPDDIAVVGVDDVEDGRYSRPSLTTVALDKAQIARTAVELLAARLDGAQDAPPRVVVAAHRLVVRESTAGARAATLEP